MAAVAPEHANDSHMTRFAERTFVTEPYRLAPPPAPLRERPEAIAYSGFAYPAGRTQVEYAREERWQAGPAWRNGAIPSPAENESPSAT